VRYRRFLAGVHAALAPPTYLEIGINRGGTLALSRTRTIAIDPDFHLEHPVPADAVLFREASDDYFQRGDRLESFEGRPISLAFIDGMHWVEYALRDFINVERHADWSTVIVFDDVFPRKPAHAQRDRVTKAWTGDVYKLVDILARHRPDLICLGIDTEPAGVLLVLGADPANRVLTERYDEIVGDAMTPDPQEVPVDILERRGVLDGAEVLAGSFWTVLRDGRTADAARKEGLRRLRRALRRDFAAVRGSRRAVRSLRRALTPAGGG